MTAAKHAPTTAHQIKDINYRYWINTRRQLLFMAAIILVSLLVVLVGIWPQVQSTLELRANIQQERQRLAKLENKVAALERADTLQLVDQSGKINDLLPSKKPLIEMMTSMNQVAEQTQVSFTNIEVRPGEISTQSADTQPDVSRRSENSRSGRNSAPAPASAKYQQLDLNVTVEGNLEQISDFIEQMELTAPMANVTSISLNEKQKSAEESQPFEAELTISSYYFTQSVAAAIESPLPTLSAGSEVFLQQLASFVFPTNDQGTTIRGGGQQDLFGVETLGPGAEI